MNQRIPEIGIFSDGKQISRVVIDDDPLCGVLSECLAPYREIYVVADNLVVRKSPVVSEILAMMEGRGAAVYGMDADEQSKTMDTVLAICGWLLDKGADRDAMVLAIGGGITTDMAGFAASIYKRGVTFAYIPTTLLSQVDAAVGGKTGVNFDRYKNMLGVIRQPEFTYINANVLASLPRRDFLSGAAEMLKTFIIEDNGHYGQACRYLVGGKDDMSELTALTAAAAAVKAGVVSRDQFESGERRKLNLGHTFAHAVETLARRRSSEGVPGEWDITHGEAVAVGIVMSARLAEALARRNPDFVVEAGLADRIEADFRSCGLPVECPFGIDEMVPVMAKDKKAEGGIIHFVLPRGIGDVTTFDLAAADVAGMLK
ncbi:MAG: 3-dehydroquinate synthase family protein [Candidatus Cryptobacteroides sp.]